MNIFTNQHYQEVLAYLRPFTDIKDVQVETFTQKFMKYEHDIVRQAVKDRYAGKYRVLTHFRTTTIEFDKVEYKPGEFKQEGLVEQAHAMFIAALAEKKDEILSSVNGTDEMFLIDAITRDFLLGTAENLPDKKQAFDLVKSALREVLNLDHRDYIVNQRGEIFIRKFVCAQKKEAERKQQLADVISLEEVFAKIGINDTIDKAIIELTTTTFDFNVVLPSVFTDSYLPAFLKTIASVLIDEGLNEEVATLTAKKLFREESHAILTATARRLLDCVANKEKGAEHFLMWFDGGIEVDEKGKFYRPVLSDLTNQSLPASLVKGIAITLKTQNDRLKEARKTKLQMQESITEQSEKVARHQQEMLDVKAVIDSSKLDLSQLKRDVSRMEEKLQRKMITIAEYNAEKKALNFYNEEDSINKKIIELKKDEEKVNHDIKESKRVLDGYERTLKRAIDDIDGITHSIQEPQRKYDVYVEAIAKALVAKKVRI